MNHRRTVFCASAAFALLPSWVEPALPDRPGRGAGADSQSPERPHEYDYRHPLGVLFDHAPRWRVDETALGLQLTPPDARTGPRGPEEYYAITLLGADPSVRSLDEPRAAQLLAQLVTSQLPFLRPVGKARRVPGRSAGRRFDFGGTSPFGTPVECRVYGTLIEGWFVSLSALGESRVLDAREPALLETFTTLALEAPRADHELAGTWYAQSFSSAGSTGDRINASTTTGVTLLADGRLRSSTSTAVSGSTGGRGRPAGSVSGVTDALLQEGRWARVGDQLWALWREGGATRYTIHVQGTRGRREMLLTVAGSGNKILWTEYQ